MTTLFFFGVILVKLFPILVHFDSNDCSFFFFFLTSLSLSLSVLSTIILFSYILMMPYKEVKNPTVKKFFCGSRAFCDVYQKKIENQLFFCLWVCNLL